MVYFVNDYIHKRRLENVRDEFSISSNMGQNSDTEIDVPVDFKALKKKNNDIYAWINVPGTKIDYPILQSEKNQYYLNRDIEKKWSAYGSIFTDTYNNKEFTDFNTIIYGHNMKNGTMFGGLKKFCDADFFKENRYINVYMDNRVLKYEIFAVCSWDNKHILANRDFSIKENRSSYIDEIYASQDRNSQISKDIKVTADDRIITLSTCINNDSKRFIVSGVLIYDSQNP